MTTKVVLLISDVHTRFGVINEQILHAEAPGNYTVSQVVVLGDFGFFGDELHDYFRRRKNRFLRPVSFIDGNHEDHGALPKLARQYADVVEFLPRGSLVELGPLNGLCLGGARYMDAAITPRGSEISLADMEACLEHNAGSVDLILTHDCPEGLGMPNTPGLECYGTPGVPQLAQLKEFFQPPLWFFGHHHRWFDIQRDQTRFIGLPESWLGYVLLGADGMIEIVEHEVDLRRPPWWQMGWFNFSTSW